MKSYDGWVRLKGGVEIAGLWVEQKDVERLLSLNAELLEMLQKAADTFADFGKGLRLLNRPLLADACAIAEQEARAVIAKTTPPTEQGSPL